MIKNKHQFYASIINQDLKYAVLYCLFNHPAKRKGNNMLDIL